MSAIAGGPDAWASPSARPEGAHEPADPVAIARRRRRRRRRSILIGVAVALALAVLLVIADGLARAQAEADAKRQIEQQLPLGATGHVDIDIRGLSFLWQLARGALDEVHLASSDLAVGGVPLVLDAELRGVATAGPPRAATVDGSLRLAPETLASLLRIPGADSSVVLEEGQVRFTSTASLLGLPLAVDGVGALALDGGEIVLDITQLRLAAGGAQIDPAAAFPELGSARLPVCAAALLPDGLELADLAVHPDGVTAAFHADDLGLDEASLSARGSCGG